MNSDLESRVSRKLMRRIIPFVMLLYFISFLDRVNVGFAAMTMNKAIRSQAAVSTSIHSEQVDVGRKLAMRATVARL